MVILRLSRPTALLTAAVFEQLFAEQLGAEFDIRHADTGAWCRALLGPSGVPWLFDAAAHRLAATVGDADFLAPNYEAVLFAPLFLALRNRARLRTRLLLVAHAPGAWALEWALLGRLMAPGDLIVAPSQSAADLIVFLNPALAPFITIIPHPMAALVPCAAVTGGGVDRIVSLSRIHPSKLLHRQIEALDVLRERGRPIPVLEIAGAPLTPNATEYFLSLKAKITRLRLEANVRFVGAIQGPMAKAQFLTGARALVNLSVSIEESFGKAPVEALSSGVPVLSTRWDGLPEAVGECGVLLAVDCTRPGVPADVGAECVADGLEQLLDAPPSAEACRSHARRFCPAVVLPRYRAALEAAVDIASGGLFPEVPFDADHAAPERGLLAASAPLTAMSWNQLFRAYCESCDDMRRSWEQEDGNQPGPVGLRGVLLQGTSAPIERFLAGRAQMPPPTPRIATAAGDFVEQVAVATQCGTSSTRVACLVYLWQAGRLDEFLSGLQSLEGHQTPAVLVLRAEAACLAGDSDKAFERACHGLDLHRDDGVTAFRLRQVSRIAREAGGPARALPLLSEWLGRFPDSPDSGPVWLDMCVNALRVGGGHHLDARVALAHARALLGDSPVVDRIEHLIVYAEAAAAVSA
jgi:glycosyltransferase involved in cell wall biosynthesis